MPTCICVLAPWEHADFAHGVQPNCANHAHVKRVEAAEMTGAGDTAVCYQESGKPRAVARWVGPRHIVLLTAWEWRVRRSGGFAVRQLVELGT